MILTNLGFYEYCFFPFFFLYFRYLMGEVSHDPRVSSIRRLPLPALINLKDLLDRCQRSLDEFLEVCYFFLFFSFYYLYIYIFLYVILYILYFIIQTLYLILTIIIFRRSFFVNKFLIFAIHHYLYI